jgi:hypothetical protein
MTGRIADMVEVIETVPLVRSKISGTGYRTDHDRMSIYAEEGGKPQARFVEALVGCGLFRASQPYSALPETRFFFPDSLLRALEYA